jgi:hypothetical protein
LFGGHRFGGGASGFRRWVAHQRGYLGDGSCGVNPWCRSVWIASL